MKEANKYAQCLLSILDSLKFIDNGDDEQQKHETLSEIMFRKMKAYDIDLNKELDFTHLAPVKHKFKFYVNEYWTKLKCDCGKEIIPEQKK